MMQLYGRNVDGAGGNACEDDDVADDTTRAQRELQEDIRKATNKNNHLQALSWRSKKRYETAQALETGFNA